MPRLTRVRTDDIADDQLIDTHPKPGTRLRKLVDKKVLDKYFVNGIVVPGGATSVPLDESLIGFTPAVGPTGLGVVMTGNHSVFQGGTTHLVPDGFDEEVVGNLTYSASLLFSINMTISLATGVTAGPPGDVQVGDTMMITGQGLGSPFITTILTKTPAGPNFNLGFSDVFPGATTTYVAERVARWSLAFRDSNANPFPMTAGTYDIGVVQRVYLADVSEFPVLGALRYPELIPGMTSDSGGPYTTLDLVLDPDETFMWVHALATEIPVVTWWVEWPGGYPTGPLQFYYGLQGEWPEALPTELAVPVDFRHVDDNTIEIHNKNTIAHRVRAIGHRPA